MKWPWVSRVAYEKAEAEAKFAWRYAQSHQDRHDALLEKYHALALQPAPLGVARPGLALAPEPSSASDQAIDEVVKRFGNNTKLRRRLQQFQEKQQKAGVDEDEIADAITNWRDPDEDES